MACGLSIIAQICAFEQHSLVVRIKQNIRNGWNKLHGDHMSVELYVLFSLNFSPPPFDSDTTVDYFFYVKRKKIKEFFFFEISMKRRVCGKHLYTPIIQPKQVHSMKNHFSAGNFQSGCELNIYRAHTYTHTYTYNRNYSNYFIFYSIATFEMFKR